MIQGVKILMPALLVASVFVLPQTAAAKTTNDCSAVTIDNNTADWENISALVTDGQDITGTDYYYDGATWSTTNSAAAIYSTNVDQMSDLENIKVCNSATQLQLYIDSFHPLLAYNDIANATYYEFGDPTGADGELTLPANLDFWLVFKLQEENSVSIYYYVIHLYAEAGSLGLENGPQQVAMYQETVDTDFDTATFNPNEDTLLVEIEDTSSKSTADENTKDDGGKNIDAAGGFESGPSLLNSDGTGLLSLTGIEYGDVVDMAVQTYSGSLFTKAITSTVNATAVSDDTDSTNYKIKRIGVQNVAVSERTATSAVVSWDAVAGADSYQVVVRNRQGKKMGTFKTVAAEYSLTNLVAQRRYHVRVRALIGDTYTPFSSVVTFLTKATE